MERIANPFRLWENLMETTQPILVHDGDGHLLYGNLRFARFAELPGEIGEWVGTPVSAFDDLEFTDGEGNRLELREWLVGLNPESQARRLMRRKDGTGGWLRFHSFHTADHRHNRHVIIAVGLATAPLSGDKLDAQVGSMHPAAG